ncbi:unnamed protein product [Polarella glacialis]|uniref:Uncharacterized protein n=1 Tax=Polarella glacialis TaxID=89957 RepID=A0A813IH57_POLGL|nr:unnamed protein product [Polarella glacialis]
MDDVASSYQAFLIDSGALYVDERVSTDENGDEGAAPVVDYTRHMMAASVAPGSSVEVARICGLACSGCGGPAVQTPLGRCNHAFAALGPALTPWRLSGGIAQEDTVRALRAVSSSSSANNNNNNNNNHNQNNFSGGSGGGVLLRLAGGELRGLALPSASNAAGREEQRDKLLDCLASALVPVFQKADLAKLELVVSFSDGPVLPRPTRETSWRGAQGRREDVPPPVFSFCAAGGDAWEIPLPPSLCPEFRPPCRLPAASGDTALGRTGQDEGLEEVAACYIFQLLSGFAELMRYAPHGPKEEALTSDDLPASVGASVVGAWKIPPLGRKRAKSEAFVARCAMLIAEAAL